MDPFQELWGPTQTAGAGPLTLNLLKHFEGYTPKPKWDSKQYSVGYSTRWNPGDPIGTREDHEAALAREAGQANSWLDRNVKTPLDETKRAVLTSAGYNLGTGEKGIGALLPDINRGDWPTVAERLRTFNKSDGAVNPGLVSRRNIEADMLLGRAGPSMGNAAPPAAQENKMPMMQPPGFPQPQPQPQGPLTSAMGGLPDSMVPSIFGGSDQQGYFGRLLSDPTFLMGTSVLGAGLSGRDAGTALTQGAQAASATSEMAEKRRRAMAWQKMFGADGTQPNMSSPMLKNIPPEILPVIHAMGPDEGMRLLGQITMKKMTGKQVGVAPAGSTMYDMDTGKPLFQAPTESPYNKELAQEQAKADVKTGEHVKAGQQMLDLTGHIRQLAGAEGSPEREAFNDATGPIQGTDWYQGIKGFINSKAITPVVHNKLKQDMGTIELLATRAYLSGQGQVTEAERDAVKGATGRVVNAPSGAAALEALDNLDQVVKQVFMKPPTGAPGSQQPAAPGAAPPPMPADVAMPGMSVAGGVPSTPPPQEAPQPAPQGSPTPGPQGGAMVTATGPNGEKVQLDPASGQWQPVQAPPGGQAAPSPAAAAPVDKGPFSAPRPNGPNILDKWVLKAGAERKPELIQQYDAAYGPGEAAKVLGGGKPPAQGAPLGVGRGSYMGAR